MAFTVTLPDPIDSGDRPGIATPLTAPVVERFIVMVPARAPAAAVLILAMSSELLPPANTVSLAGLPTPISASGEATKLFASRSSLNAPAGAVLLIVMLAPATASPTWKLPRSIDPGATLPTAGLYAAPEIVISWFATFQSC